MTIMYPELSEQERFPIMTDAGRRLLYHMRQHPCAPTWNWPNGEQLNAEGLERVRSFASQLKQVRPGQPEWLQDLTDYCLEHVPFYRRRAAGQPCRFEHLPSCSRADLAPRVWDFVPDCEPLDDLVTFCTSGTTGHPARLPFHPVTAACGIPMIEHALARYGIAIPNGPEGVAITNVAAYRDAFTTAIVVAYLREAGCVRVNLHPSAWRDPAHRQAYINQWQAPIWLGDPIALAEMQKLGIDYAPKAIVSSIMRLPQSLADSLARQYDCPVIDLYALTEVGILGIKTPEGHEVLPHDVYVEVLGSDDQPLAEGVRGEVAVTSRRNPYLPLLRYRTGDFAAIRRDGARSWLIDLEGRQPVQFPLASGRIVHSMEVTRLMRRHPIHQYQLHQAADGGFTFAYRGLADIKTLITELAELLETPARLDIQELPSPSSGNHKVIEYRSEVGATS